MNTRILISLCAAAVLIAGCARRDEPKPSDPATEPAPPPATTTTPGTEPAPSDSMTPPPSDTTTPPPPGN